MKLHLSVAESSIPLRVRGKPSAITSLINLHQNEKTSIEAGARIVQSHDARLVHFASAAERTLSVDYQGQSYRFDPNRIFSEAGIQATLARYQDKSPEAGEVSGLAASVHVLAEKVWDHLVSDRTKLVIALHNTGDDYCIFSYVEDPKEKAFIDDVHIVPGRPRHGFFYVLSPAHFMTLKKLGHQVVLQKANLDVDDGSLSVHCARHKMPYINVEAPYGALGLQIEMLRAAISLVGP